MNRRWWILTGLVLILGLLWVALDRSPRARAEASLRDAAERLSARAGRSPAEREQLALEVIQKATSENTRVDLPGAGGLGRAALERRLMAWLKRRPHAVVSLEGVAVRVQGDQAHAEGELSISDSQAGDLHRARHRFQAKLRRTDAGWVLERASVGEKLEDEPEARP